MRDNGGEWQGEFKELLEKQGVKILPGLPYVSETDSVIEAFNKEFEAFVECLLMAAGAPYSMWSWAGRHFCFNYARTPDGWSDGSYPYKRRWKKDHSRVLVPWGCEAEYLNREREKVGWKSSRAVNKSFEIFQTCTKDARGLTGCLLYTSDAADE